MKHYTLFVKETNKKHRDFLRTTDLEWDSNLQQWRMEHEDAGVISRLALLLWKMDGLVVMAGFREGVDFINMDVIPKSTPERSYA